VGPQRGFPHQRKGAPFLKFFPLFGIEGLTKVYTSGGATRRVSSTHFCRRISDTLLGGYLGSKGGPLCENGLAKGGGLFYKGCLPQNQGFGGAFLIAFPPTFVWENGCLFLRPRCSNSYSGRVSLGRRREFFRCVPP